MFAPRYYQTEAVMAVYRFWEKDYGNWRTKCRNIHIFIDGTPAQNEYEFCPYCGAKIETVIYNTSRERL